MNESNMRYRGKPVSEMTREELIKALVEMNALMEADRKAYFDLKCKVGGRLD